ncbi:MAG: carboxypeptidase-like regulatory domain-containing protein, partial [Bacteroidia bacterium]
MFPNSSKYILFLVFSCFFLVQAVKGQNITISGYVKDSTNGETLIGATVKNKEATIGTVTNAYGYFSLSIPPNTKQIICSYIGFEPRVINLNGRKLSGLQIA